MSTNDVLLTYTESYWNVTEIVENYGWYLLILVILMAYVYVKLKPLINDYLQYKADQEYSAQYHKNPDMAAHIAAQQAASQRLQDKYNTDAAIYKQKLEEREAKKREEWLAQQSGYILGNGTTNKKKTSLRPEYNPLMGDNTRSYRPQRKSCPGGSCGKK